MTLWYMVKSNFEYPRCFQYFQDNAHLKKHLNRKNICRDIGIIVKEKDHLISVYKELIEFRKIKNATPELNYFGTWNVPEQADELNKYINMRFIRAYGVIGIFLKRVVFNENVPKNSNLKYNITKFEVFTERSEKFVGKSDVFVFDTLAENTLAFFDKYSEVIWPNKLSYVSRYITLLRRAYMRDDSVTTAEFKKFIQQIIHSVETFMD